MRGEVLLAMRKPGGNCLFDDPTIVVMCTLHMEMRVGERLLYHMFMSLCHADSGFDKEQIDERWAEVVKLIQDEAPVGWFGIKKIGKTKKSSYDIAKLTLPRQQIKKIMNLWLPSTKVDKKTGVVREVPGILDILLPIPDVGHANRDRVLGVRKIMVDYMEIVRIMSLTTARSEWPVLDKYVFDVEVEKLRVACTDFADGYFKWYGSDELTN